MKREQTAERLAAPVLRLGLQVCGGLMERQRGTGGRYRAEGAGAEAASAQPEGKVEVRRTVAAPRPKYCRVFARARFAEALPEISDALLKQAKDGSVPHLKLLVQLSGLDKAEVVPRATRRRGKSLEAVLMEEWRKDEELRARQDEAAAALAGDDED